MQRERNDSLRALSDQSAREAPGAEAGDSSNMRFSTAGSFPPVLDGVQLAALSPSDRAYGGGNKARDEEEDDVPRTPEGRIMERLSRSDEAAVEDAGRRYGVDPTDILAIITTESRGVATANAGASQKDRGRNAASGLMQVTRETWKNTQRNHPELSKYGFDAYRYDRRINILVGTAALADKRDALKRLGVSQMGENAVALITMAFNAGEGIVAEAYRRAEQAGSDNPAEDCLSPQFLKPAIAKYPSVYSYYLTGGGKGRNPGRTRERAIELKFLEISKYPGKVMDLIAEAETHGFADADIDDVMPKSPAAPQYASNDENTRTGNA